ncbi:AAA family ATPase [Helicobacter felis]|uniref:ATP-dependent Clp protease ATP-binding subunit ClpX n=1 Tax=Helicobacter felis (strain ATCC 49179 / CCUG 28539 / NCTC 12436 / CS1) TaxID=936155 RepID=E7AAG7_HELFC|nr:AAA family ATPase [Helicobacter felis]CBY82689.1 ATP-dependent Clp protease ATP-binding subunit ClpX [Helicobacter felis ATCC 49179]
MGQSKKDMDVYELKRYLILQRAGCLAWMADHAYKNFGWVTLTPFHQAQGSHLAWEKIAEDQDRYVLEGAEELEWLQEYPYRAYYFFGGISRERQAVQQEIIFENSLEVIDFLIDLYKPYAHLDPKFSQYEMMAHLALLNTEEEKDFDKRLHEEALQAWSFSLEIEIEKICNQTNSQVKIPLKSLRLFPKALSPALEKYRWGDTYIFQTTYTPLSNLPKFDPKLLNTLLSGAIKTLQKDLAGIIDGFVRPERKPKFRRKVRKQLAKLCLKKYHGVLTPERMVDYKLDQPKEDSYLKKYHFTLQGQDHYYIEQLLWIWIAQRLLEIFNGSLETRAICDQLLARLDPKQAQDFEGAFYHDYRSLKGPISWALIDQLNLPLALFKEDKRVVIAPNPDFKPHVFLSEQPNNREAVRFLLSFSTRSQKEREEILSTLGDLIPTYTPPTPRAPSKFPLLSTDLQEDFILHCLHLIDANMEALFFDDREAFIRTILGAQDQFLKEKTNLEIEDQSQFLTEKTALAEGFAKWYAKTIGIDIEMEALFFDDREAFIRKFLQAQHLFLKENAQDEVLTSLAPKTPPLAPKTSQASHEKYSPKAIKAYLDQFVIGQEQAKKQMSLVFSDHYKRIRGQSSLEKANAICIGPSGSGKTFLIEMATKYLDLPYCIANAASFTPTGYIGNETNQMFATLYSSADKDIQKAQKGVLVLDEIDKLGQGSWHDKEWRQGVQNELLKVIEKGIVSFDYGGRASGETITLQTDHMLFIVLGHFEKLWKDNSSSEKLPQFSNEDLIECGMKREFLRRFSVRVVFEAVDIEMLTELLDRRLKPFQEEFRAEGSVLEFSQEAKHLLVKNALKEGVGMSGLDQKLHEVLMPLRFDLENYYGLRCLIDFDHLGGVKVMLSEL